MMKFKIVYIILFLSFSLSAQTNTAKIEFEKSCQLLDFIDLGKNGFIIKTGKEKAAYSKKLKWEVHCFDNDLNLIYSMPIKKEQLDTRSGNPINASHNGSYFYHEEFKITTSFGAGKGHLTQIKKDKSVKTFDIKYKDYKDTTLNNTFVDDNYYCMLRTKEEKKSRKNKNVKKTYLLYKFDHATFNRKEVILELPQVVGEKGIDKTFWKFSDQDETFIYMERKDLNFESGNHVYHVVVLNKSDGKIANQFALNFSIAPKHIRPSNNNIEIKGARYSSFDDFYTKTNTMNTGNATSSSTFILHTSRAFGKLKLDIDAQKAYVFGLYGDKKFKRVGPINKGYYLLGYDFTGKKIFETKKGLPVALAKESGFRIHNIPYQRILKFSIKDDNLELGISSKKQRHKAIFSKTGDFDKTVTVESLRKTKGADSYAAIKSTISDENVISFLNANQPVGRKNDGQLGVFKSDSDYTILWSVNDESIEFHYFKK